MCPLFPALDKPEWECTYCAVVHYYFNRSGLCQEQCEYSFVVRFSESKLGGNVMIR